MKNTKNLMFGYRYEYFTKPVKEILYCYDVCSLYPKMKDRDMKLKLTPSEIASKALYALQKLGIIS